MLIPFPKRGSISNLGPLIQFVKPFAFVFGKLDTILFLLQKLFVSLFRSLFHASQHRYVLLTKRRYRFWQLITNNLNLQIHFLGSNIRKIIVILLTKFIDTIIENRHFDLFPGFLLGQCDQPTFIIGDEVLLTQLTIVTITLATEVTKKEDITYYLLLASQFHVVHGINLLVSQVYLCSLVYLFYRPVFPNS